MRKRLLAVVALGAWGLVACGGDGGAGPTAIAADQNTPAQSENAASKAEWAEEGQRLRAFKNSKNEEARTSGRALPSNAADFAYQSEPVDITTPGKYELNFGPVDDWFDFPKSPDGVSWNLPPDYIEHFEATWLGGRTVTVEGHRMFQSTLVVTNVKSRYLGLTAWVY